MVVENGGTAMIGGLASTTKRSLMSGLPVVENIFRRNRTEDDTVQLTILIQADIISRQPTSKMNDVIMIMDREAYRAQMKQALNSWGLN